MVVTEDQVLDRLVGVLTQPREPVPGGRRGGASLEGDDEVLALDRADVGIALGGEGVDPLGQDLERLGLLAQVR